MQANNKDGLPQLLHNTRLMEIFNGSPVATFVLDREHRVALWNRACEVLTGVSAASVVGTRDQWRAFYASERPVMADLILAGSAVDEVEQHYPEMWKISKLIDGAFEAEDFFPNFGVSGRWVFFTAAPLRDDDGEVIGAIETLQDVTERRQAQAELKDRAERETKRTASYFQEVLSNLPFGVVVLDRDLNIVFWNDKAETLYKLPPGSVARGASFLGCLRAIAARGFYGPGNPFEQAQSRFETLSEFSPHAIELNDPTGGTLLIRASPVVSAGERVGLILLQEDISERKQSELQERERDMEKSLTILRHAIGNISQGISMYDADLRLMICNQRFMDLLDVPASLGIPGTPFEAHMRFNAQRGEYGPGDVEELVRMRVERARNVQPHVFERERPGGAVIEIAGRPLPDGGFITTYTDITERKRNELALREFNATLERKVADRTEALQETLGDLEMTRAHLAQIVDGSPVAAFVLDRGHRVTHWNHACEKLTGVAASEILGTRNQWRPFARRERPVMADLILSSAPEEEVDRYYKCWKRSELIEGALDAEGFFPQFGEHGRWLYFTAAPLRDAGGQTIGAIETLRDITEQRKAEADLNDRANALEKALRELGAVIENLQQTQDELVRSEKLAGLGAMVAGIAHELNTPIGNSLMVASHFVETSRKLKAALITGLKRSMLDEYLNDNAEVGDVLVRNLTKAAELVSSFKQVAVDQTSSQRRRFDLAEMVSEVVLTLGPTIRKTPYTIEQDVAKEIVMESYPGPLGQVLTNLVNNAILHGFDGCMTGHIRIAAEKPVPGNPVVLTVSDDGRGIPPEVLPRIFDPFFTTRLGQGGSGLGLNIVHNMVFGILGGKVGVDSTPGQGVCFTLSLPPSAPEPDAGEQR